MRAVVFTGIGHVSVTDAPDPVVRDDGDAVVEVEVACVCGSDLWTYRGLTERARHAPMGHEFVGRVSAVGPAVTALRVGDRVIAPFRYSCGSCVHCRNGMTSACAAGSTWGYDGGFGGQAGRVRVPFADATLVKVPVGGESTPLSALLALSDVLPTGHHAAVSAGVKVGSVVAVIGDGAVGVSAIMAARRLGAARIIALSSHEDRQRRCLQAGADEIVGERGEVATQSVLTATGGVGVDAFLECVGTEQSFRTAIGATRPGGSVGFVGIPHGVDLPVDELFRRNIRLAGGMAPARAYIEELLPDVISGRLDAGLLFDADLPFEDAVEAYRLMDTRERTKVMLTLPPS